MPNYKLDPKPKLVVKQTGDGFLRFVCDDARSGTPPVGRGATVLEALGDWVLQNGLVDITCEPPELLAHFMVLPGAIVPTRKPYSRRED